VDRLLHTRETAGSDCVNQYDGADHISNAEMLTVPADILIPCALSWSISGSNARDIQARTIICGANNPVTEKAREILLSKGILYFPDFVSNSGGVLGSIVGSLGLDRAKISEVVRQIFTPKVADLLAKANRANQPLEVVAKRIATTHRDTMQQAATRKRSNPFSWILSVARHGLLPPIAMRTFGPTYIRKTMT
jgi:glutamate dehydrogenase (NAD(P)+)